jgi:hypothetical protein
MAEFEGFIEYKMYLEYTNKIEEFENLLNQDIELMNVIKDEELKLFGFSSSFNQFDYLVHNFQPYSLLWKSIAFFVE